jgi:hypothetical protein
LFLKSSRRRIESRENKYLKTTWNGDWKAIFLSSSDLRNEMRRERAKKNKFQNVSDLLLCQRIDLRVCVCAGFIELHHILKLNTNMPISKLRMNDIPILLALMFFSFREQLWIIRVGGKNVLQAIILRRREQRFHKKSTLDFFLYGNCILVVWEREEKNCRMNEWVNEWTDVRYIELKGLVEFIRC